MPAAADSIPTNWQLLLHDLQLENLALFRPL
jgi:hypothetical protein